MNKKIPTNIDTIVVEKIANGFIIKFPMVTSDSSRVFRATLNGVVEVITQAFSKPIIKLDKSPKTTTVVDHITKKDTNELNH